ncbi:MAG: TrkH family potassium uptake protein [Planctomycetota bacterium]
MNLGQVARMMAGFAAFFVLAQLPPLLLALTEEAHATISPRAGFVASIGIGTLVGALLWLAGRGASDQVYRKDAIAIAGLSWLLAGLLGAIPFQWSGLLPSPADAVFECVSGLTTTGASVLGSGPNPAIEATPASLLLWRALLQWIGGIGVVLVFVALLPAMGVTGKNLLSSESVSVGTESFQQRALEKARLIGALYTVLTAACALLLVLCGDYRWFDAICHAFTALATGGYSTRASIRDFDSLGGEIVLTVFMFLAGTSLAFVAAHLRDGIGGVRALVRSGEFRIYLLVTGLVVGGCTVALLRAGKPLTAALREASFNGISVLTSTGYATADFQAWPATALLLLFGAMIVGGCTGSTAGGLKQVRLLVILKLLAYTIRHFVRPKSVERIKLDNEALPAAVISSVLAIVLLWLLTIALGALVISFDARLDFVAALTTSATMVGNCGPALMMVDPTSAAEVLAHGGTAAPLAGTMNVGPFGGFGELRAWTKVVAIAQMLLGRLELLTALALFSPALWRR